MKNLFSIRKAHLLKFIILGGLFFFTIDQLSAQAIPYRIMVKTKDGSWTDGFGTDNYIDIILHGTKGKSENFDLLGSHEMGDNDNFTRSFKDLGVITHITLDVNGQLADKWTPEIITILRNTGSDNKNAADGYSEFLINRELSYNPEKIACTYKKSPRVSVGPTGNIITQKNKLIRVHFGDNPHPSADQLMMKYVESWSNVDRISMSNEEAESLDAHATLSYSSPETIYGQFSAEVGAGWSSVITKMRTEETEKIVNSQFNWEFVLPANTSCFRLVEFEVPQAIEVIEGGGKKHVVRRLHDEIIPTGFEKFLFVPKIVEGQIVPIAFSEIEENWLKHMDEGMKDKIKGHYMFEWLKNKWITM